MDSKSTEYCEGCDAMEKGIGGENQQQHFGGCIKYDWFDDEDCEKLFSYPLTFESEDEHISHIKNNEEFYRQILDLKNKNEELELEKKKNSDLANIIESLNQRVNDFDVEKKRHEEELRKTKEILEDTTCLKDLLEKKNGVSVVHKGACDEKYVEIVLKEVAGDSYIVDNSDGTKMMDVRMIRKDGAFTIGVECKDKKTVTKEDIEKFRRDKCLRKFKRSIFINTSPIKNIIEEVNQVKINGDEMWIVTNDHVFLAAVMKLYLANLEYEKDNVFDKKEVFDNIIDSYNTWQATKKQHRKLDQTFLRLMNLTPEFEKNIIGHIYLGVEGKFKAGRAPY